MIRRIVFTVSLLLVFSAQIAAKSWNGIVPGRSTREDVERALKLTIDSTSPQFKLESTRETVVFIFWMRDKAWPVCEQTLALGTVLEINVTPNVPVPIDNAQFNRNRLKKLEPPPGLLIIGDAYIDEDEGFGIKVVDGLVKLFVYTPTKQNQHVCPGYYESHHRFIDGVACKLCPTIAVDCPDEAEAGAVFTFTARVTMGNPAPTLTYNWTVSAGKIVAGQGTETIKVDAGNQAGQSINATVEVDPMDPECSKTASCATQIIPRKKTE